MNKTYKVIEVMIVIQEIMAKKKINFLNNNKFKKNRKNIRMKVMKIMLMKMNMIVKMKFILIFQKINNNTILNKNNTIKDNL